MHAMADVKVRTIEEELLQRKCMMLLLQCSNCVGVFDYTSLTSLAIFAQQRASSLKLLHSASSFTFAEQQITNIKEI